MQSLKQPDDLKNAFCWLMEREDEIRAHLTEIMPTYAARAKEAGDVLAELMAR